jgi:aspartate carbamoyltransferase catalytic subunit
VEIDDAVADDPHDSIILAQVSCGVAARMAVLLRAIDR